MNSYRSTTNAARKRWRTTGQRRRYAEKKKGRADGVRERTIERERDNGTLMIFFSFFLFTLIYRLCGEYGTRRAKERTRKSNDDNYDRNSFVLFVCFFLEEIAP